MAGEQIEAKAVELIGKLEALAPQVTQMALDVARYTAMQNLTIGIVAAVVAMIALPIGGRNFRKLLDGDDDPGVFFGALFCGALGMTAALIVPLQLLDIWNWVALSRPEMLLAKKALGL